MEHLRRIGKHFGYPNCCIDWFVKRFEGSIKFDLTLAQQKSHNDKGFIPCPSCAEKVASGEVNIKDLIQDREHPVPYPGINRRRMIELIHE